MLDIVLPLRTSLRVFSFNCSIIRAAVIFAHADQFTLKLDKGRLREKLLNLILTELNNQIIWEI